MRPRGRFKCKNNALGIYYKNNFDYLLKVQTYAKYVEYPRFRDVVLPEGYLQAVDAELNAAPCDAFGGPDRAHESFTPMQKAINYAMSPPAAPRRCRG